MIWSMPHELGGLQAGLSSRQDEGGDKVAGDTPPRVFSPTRLVAGNLQVSL